MEGDSLARLIFARLSTGELFIAVVVATRGLFGVVGDETAEEGEAL